MLLVESPLGNSLAVELPALDRATLVRIQVSQPSICDPIVCIFATKLYCFFLFVDQKSKVLIQCFRRIMENCHEK